MSTPVAQFVRERTASEIVSCWCRLDSDCSFWVFFNS